MTFHNLVPDLDICKELKDEAKFPQKDGIYYWHRWMRVRDDFDNYEIRATKESDGDDAWKGMYKDVIRAPTTDELLEALRNIINSKKILKIKELEVIRKCTNILFEKKPANVLGKLYVWWKKKD